MSPPAEHLRSVLCQAARSDLHVFAQLAFGELYREPYMENWHIIAIARQLERVHVGECRRLVISMPPRTMKSLLASVCFPAWFLGRNPGARVICASYAQPLANEFAFQTRRLMQTPLFRLIFPGTHLDPRRSSLEEIATTAGGSRLATSVGGTLTGRGADIIVIDDPIKAADAHSEVERSRAIAWFTGTVVTRLNNPRTGRIVVVAQRLHMDDLPGHLLASGGWDELVLPLVEWQPRRIQLSRNHFLERLPGDVLHPARFGSTEIRALKAQLGQSDYDAQYNQRPLPPGGALFKREWLQYFEGQPTAQNFDAIIQSWDTAYSTQGGADYSVCSTWGVRGTQYCLLDMYRERLEFPALERKVHQLRQQWHADIVIVEAAGSGISLYQNIARGNPRHWLKCKAPEGGKQDRASKQSPKFERGEICIPRSAAWLEAFEQELMSFPHGKHDDQVDSVVQFLAAVDTGKLLQEARRMRRQAQ